MNGHEGGRRVSVLVVEDNPDHVLLLQRRLTDEGMSVRTATTAQQALESLAGIDIVLLDYLLPDKNGLEALEEIRRSGGPSVVMVTGMGSEEVAVRAMRAGAIDYVVKDSNYLRMLPEVVDRAWRLHDLARRAGKMQRLALLVHKAEDREEIFSEIVSGAQQLLDAVASVLLLESDIPHQLEVVAGVGEDIDFVPSFMKRASEIVSAGKTAIEADQSLLVPLTGAGTDVFGMLAILSPQPRDFPPEEVELAETFASFAAIALTNLRRRELERSLIAQLQETIELRRDFVNSISHELRTPLACISGFSTTVLNHWDRLDEDTIKTSIEKIRRHGGDLTELVERLLDFGSIEQGDFEPDIRPVDLRTEVELTIEAFGPLVTRRTVKTEIPEVKVQADQTLLHRVFANLLSNAVKASDPDSTIQIRAIAPDGMVRVEVIDHGHGLSPDDARHVFDPFWRTQESVKAAKRGSGIGLTLVKEYVRSMGGQVGVESEQGKGSTFFFTLPRAD